MKKHAGSLAMISLLAWSVNGQAAQTPTIEEILKANVGTAMGYDQSQPESKCSMSICRPGSCPQGDAPEAWTATLSSSQLTARASYFPSPYFPDWRLDVSESKLDVVVEPDGVPFMTFRYDPATLEITMASQEINASSPPVVCLFGK